MTIKEIKQTKSNRKTEILREKNEEISSNETNLKWLQTRLKSFILEID